MEKLLSCPLAFMAESVMELADSFGLFAVFYAHHSKKTSYHWQSGCFTGRQTEDQHTIFLQLIFPDGQIGQTITSDWSIPAVEQAFHHARTGAKSKPGLSAFLQQLSASEKRTPYPYSATEVDEPAPEPTQLACLMDRHLQELLPSLSADLLDTSLCVYEETGYSLRSDGIHYHTKINRANCRHTLFSLDLLQPFHFQHGIRLTADTPFSQLVEPLREGLIQWKIALPTCISPEPEVKGNVVVNSFIFDASIIARLISAWLRNGCHDSSRSPVASLWLEPAVGVGMIGHSSLHPTGYLLTPAPLVSAAVCDRELLQAFREPYPLSGHFLCQAPVHLQQMVAPREMFASLPTQWYGGDKLYLCEGVAQFYSEKNSDSFFLLPARMYQVDDTGSVAIKPSWIETPLSQLFSSLYAGFGPLKTVWSEASEDCSFSLPAYLFYHPFERRRSS